MESILQEAGCCVASYDRLAEKRIARLTQFLGQEDIDKPFARVREKFARSVDPAEWQRFLATDQSQLREKRQKVLEIMMEAFKKDFPAIKVSPNQTTDSSSPLVH
jgi:hypothetical protein